MSITVKDGDGLNVEIANTTDADGNLVPITSPLTTGSTKEIITQFLSSNGDGTGTYVCNGNYATPSEFYITPPADTIYRMVRMIVYIEDTAGMDIGLYGNGINLSAGTDGVRVGAFVGGSTINLDGGIPVKTNGQWRRLCYDAGIAQQGSGNDNAAARYTFAKSGTEIRLTSADKLYVSLEGDFSGLVDHTFMVQGYIE